MPERTMVGSVTQFGLETTPGTSVAANKQFSTFMVTPKPQEKTRGYRIQGAQYDVLEQFVQNWTEADLSGIPDYLGDVYLWSSLLGAATITTVGVSSKKWVWTEVGLDVDTPKTLTVELGSSVRAGKFTYGTVTSLGWKWSRKDITLDGKMIGQQYQDGISLTSTPTLLAPIPVAPIDFQVYLDSTSAGLGGTRLTRVFSCELSIDGKYGPIWPSDRSKTDWTALVNLVPKMSIKLGLEADSNGMALLTTLRGSKTQWLRLEHQGAVMPGESNQNYLQQTDIAVRLTDIADVGKDEEGVYATEFTFTPVYDPTWGKTFVHTMQNQLAAL